MYCRHIGRPVENRERERITWQGREGGGGGRRKEEGKGTHQPFSSVYIHVMASSDRIKCLI